MAVWILAQMKKSSFQLPYLVLQPITPTPTWSIAPISTPRCNKAAEAKPQPAGGKDDSTLMMSLQVTMGPLKIWDLCYNYAIILVGTCEPPHFVASISLTLTFIDFIGLNGWKTSAANQWLTTWNFMAVVGISNLLWDVPQTPRMLGNCPGTLAGQGIINKKRWEMLLLVGGFNPSEKY